MSTAPNFLDLPWRWQISAGSLKLVSDDSGFILLRPAPGTALLTRADDGGFRNLEADDDLAKIIAAAPDVRRHSRALLNGINLGFLDISDEAEPSFRAVVDTLREALARSGAG